MNVLQLGCGSGKPACVGRLQLGKYRWGGTQDLPVWVMRKDAMLHEEKGFFCGSWSNHRTFIMDRAVSYYVFFSDIIQHNYLMKPEAG